jgi:hypothetical protein
MSSVQENNNALLLLASQTGLIPDSGSDSGSDADSDSGSDTEPGPGSYLDSNVTVSNVTVTNVRLDKAIQFNIKKVDNAECEFSRGYLFPVKTTQLVNSLPVGASEGSKSIKYKVKGELEGSEGLEGKDKNYTVYNNDDKITPDNVEVSLANKDNNDIFVNNSIAFTHKKSD